MDAVKLAQERGQPVYLIVASGNVEEGVGLVDEEGDPVKIPASLWELTLAGGQRALNVVAVKDTSELRSVCCFDPPAVQGGGWPAPASRLTY